MPAGSLDPAEIHVPGIYVQRVVLGEKFEKRIEKVRNEHGLWAGFRVAYLFMSQRTVAKEQKVRDRKFRILAS